MNLQEWKWHFIFRIYLDVTFHPAKYICRTETMKWILLFIFSLLLHPKIIYFYALLFHLSTPPLFYSAQSYTRKVAEFELSG